MLKFILTVCLQLSFIWCVDPRICSNYSRIIASGPEFHGAVQKKGVLPLHLWWNVTNEQYGRRFFQFIEDKQINFSAGTVHQDNRIPHYPLIVPQVVPCQVFVNHKHKLIYMKNPKTAGNSISAMLKRGCQDELSETGERLGFWCLDHPKVQDIPSEEAAKKMWEEYIVITTVRNPYGRAASAFTYLLSRRVKLGTNAKPGCNPVKFTHFALAPFILGLQTSKYNCLDGDQSHDFHHVEGEGDCLVNSEGEFVVDHIISVENVADDWYGFVEDYGSREDRALNKDPYFEILKKQPVRHINQVAPGKSYADQMFRKCGQTCVFNLAQYYKSDFKVLGYEDCIAKQ